MVKKTVCMVVVLGCAMLVAACGAKVPSTAEVETPETSVVQESTTQEVVEEKSVVATTTEVESETVIQEQEVALDMVEVEQYTLPEDYAAEKEGVTYGTMETVTYDSKTTGSTRKVNVILPAGYDENETYPVLYLLHGIGGDHNEWLGANPVKLIGNLIAAGEAEEMIVVMPNVRARANDGGNPSDIFTPEHFQSFDNFINDLRDDLMPFIESTYAVKTGRENTAVAGLSMGGRESLYIGLSMADTFAYVGAFCPAPGVLPYNVEPGLFENEEFKLPEGTESFVMIVEGNNDTVVGEWPSTYHATLEQNGVEHVYYVTEGGHDFHVWSHGLYNFAKELFAE